MSYLPQSFALSCGLACLGNLIGKSDKQILQENPDILSEDSLNFVGLYSDDIKFLLDRYGFRYTWKEYSALTDAEFLEIPGTIVYLPAINHYLLYNHQGFWVDSYRNLTGIPEVGFWDELPFEPGYIIYKVQ